MKARRRALDAQIWERVRASTLRLCEVGGRWVLVAHEPVALADQDPELWGDQA